MKLNHIIVRMPINDATLQWASLSFPHLIQTKYSHQRNDYLLLSRSLLEYILQQYFNIPALPIIDYLKHGKPYFPEHPELSFNITHSTTTMAIVVANQPTVGIDIETIKARKNLQGLADRILKPTEQQWLDQQNHHLVAFFSLWSAKEAYLKATGTGLSGLSSLTLDIQQNLAHGPLKQGYLYIDKAPIYESFACYLPTQITPNLYEFNGQQLTPSSREWQAIQCLYHHPKEA